MNRKPLLAMDDALQQLLQAAQPVDGSELLPLLQAQQRILAEARLAQLDVPGFDNSAMDGYAVYCRDAGAPPLPVAQRIAAGQTGQALAPGSVARIFTGAPVPPGAEAVVMQEHCTVLEDGRVQLPASIQPGQNIRRRGEDIRAGSCVLPAGSRLRPQELGLLASLGIDQVRVHRRPKVAVFFTGDELVEPGHALASGQIYNSNRYVIVSLLQQLGCEVTDLGIVADDLQATRTALRQLAGSHDLVMTCGGVSVGEEDHVKAAVQAEGELQLWQIAIKPGKPLAFGRVGRAHFIGLPGNPVSSFVTFRMLVQPFVRALAGDRGQDQPVQALAAFDWLQPDRRREFLRVRLQQRDGQLWAEAWPNQGSGVLTSCSFADALLDVAPQRVIHRGDALPCHLLWPR